MLAQFLKELDDKARSLGFSMLGRVDAQPARRLDAYMRWISAEMHGKMGYLARPDRQIRRQDLNVILPGVKTILCVGVDYHTIQLPQEITADPNRGRISNYAWGEDYHDVMTPRLEELAAWLASRADELGLQTAAETRDRVYVDTGAILERDHAETSGLGFIGKNTMLIAPRRGSWFFLGEILTTLELPPSPSPFAPQNEHHAPTMPSCGRCTRCLNACPTNAFPQPYVLDARRCISYLSIELKDWIPRELRAQMGNWIYGCDICQEVCPFNRFALSTQEIRFQTTAVETAAPYLSELLMLDDGQFKARYANSPIKRIKRPRFIRNVCIAAGNSGNPAYLGQLIKLLTDPAPIVRGHTAWAIGQLLQLAADSKTAAGALSAALEAESDATAAEEIRLALAIS